MHQGLRPSCLDDTAVYTEEDERLARHTHRAKRTVSRRHCPSHVLLL